VGLSAGRGLVLGATAPGRRSSILRRRASGAGLPAPDISGDARTLSGRAMIEALIDGELRGAVLADLAKGKGSPPTTDPSNVWAGSRKKVPW
jgi:hypothetical protein